MWSEGGQIAHHVFAGVRKGGGEDPNRFVSRPLVLTDPVNGKTFTQETNPYLFSTVAPGAKSAQEQLNEEIAQRQADEKAASDLAAKQAADQAAANEAAFQTRLGQAGTTARTGAEQFLRQQGFDPARFNDQIAQAITRSTQSVQDLDPNPTAAFDPNLGQTILNDFTSAGRNRAIAAVNDLFSPTYASDRLSYGAADPLVNDILNEQFNPIQTSLSFARDRGQLTPSGFTAAQDLLNQRRAAAQGTVSGLAKSAIDTDRTSINDLITGAKNTAGGLQPSQIDTFNPSTFRTNADELINRELGNLGGDIRNAVGATKFVDLNDLLTQAGQRSGPTQTPVLGAGGGGGDLLLDPSDTSAAQAEQARRNAAQRGLGSQGAF